MGYCVEVSEKTFNFNPEKAKQIKEKVKKYFEEDKIQGRWISKGEVLDAENIVELFDALRFEIFLDEDDNLYKIDYMSGEKLDGCELDMFQCIAEFINDSYIEYLGEDGEKWRYVFKDGECNEVYPKVTWE
jgi:hypothetical protein